MVYPKYFDNDCIVARAMALGIRIQAGIINRDKDYSTIEKAGKDSSVVGAN